MARLRTPSAPAAPTETERLITTREFLDRSTLSRSTFWRLRRDDAELRRAVVQLTSHRIGLRESVVNTWFALRGKS
jgi:predicted DNA-binding transcriptional regulator AlpA